MLFSLSKKQYSLKKNNKFYFISPQQVILFHCTCLKSLIFIVCTRAICLSQVERAFQWPRYHEAVGSTSSLLWWLLVRNQLTPAQLGWLQCCKKLKWAKQERNTRVYKLLHFLTVPCRAETLKHHSYVLLAMKPRQQFSHVFTLNSTLHSHVMPKWRRFTVGNRYRIELLAKNSEENKLRFYGNHTSP